MVSYAYLGIYAHDFKIRILSLDIVTECLWKEDQLHHVLSTRSWFGLE
jgi:hypothetical protein